MIASKPSESSRSSAAGGLFEGLSFPAVPTTLPTSSKQYQAIAKEDDGEEEEDNSKLAAADAATDAPTSAAAAVAATATPATLSAKSLRALYDDDAVHIANGEYCYPDLPISIVSMSLPPMGLTPQRAGEDEDAETSEKTSLLAASSAPSSAAQVPPPGPPPRRLAMLIPLRSPRFLPYLSRVGGGGSGAVCHRRHRPAAVRRRR